MTTALDTNVIVALRDASDSLHVAARKALDDAWSQDTLVVSGVVYAELIVAPRRTEAFVDRFCEEAGIVVEWALEEKIWRAAGSAFQGYAARRKRQGGSRPRRLLAGFLIGAHAVENGYKLLTARGCRPLQSFVSAVDTGACVRAPSKRPRTNFHFRVSIFVVRISSKFPFPIRFLYGSPRRRGTAFSITYKLPPSFHQF